MRKECSGGKSITGVHGGVTENCKSVTGCMVSSWFTRMYSRAWEGECKIIDQPVRERVTTSLVY